MGWCVCTTDIDAAAMTRLCVEDGLLGLLGLMMMMENIKILEADVEPTTPQPPFSPLDRTIN